MVPQRLDAPLSLCEAKALFCSLPAAAGGAVNFAPAARVHLADAGLMRLPPGGDAAVSQNCISALSFPGLTQPRAPGLLCPRRQSNQNAAGDTPVPRPVLAIGAYPAPNPGFTFSHLNALRAAMRIEAYGLYAQK